MNLQKKYLLQIARRIRQHLTFSHIPIRGYISELQYTRSLRAITSFPGSSFHRKEAVSHNDTDSCMAAKNCISRGEAACKIFSKLKTNIKKPNDIEKFPCYSPKHIQLIQFIQPYRSTPNPFEKRRRISYSIISSQNGKKTLVPYFLQPAGTLSFSLLPSFNRVKTISMKNKI